MVLDATPALRARRRDRRRPEGSMRDADLRPARVVLGVTAAGALWLALWRLGVPSQVGDEVVYRTAAEAMLRGDFPQNLEHPPLVKELLALAQWLGAPVGVGSVLASRLVGAACFVATGLVVAATARRLRSPASGVVAAALWWALPLAPGVVKAHVDRYALLEGPLLLAVAAVVLLAVHLTTSTTSSAGRSGWLAWVGAGALVGLATACKLPGALSATCLLVPLAVQVLDARRAGRRAGAPVLRALAAAAAAAVAFALTYAPFGGSAVAAVRTVVASQLTHAGSGHLQTVAGTTYAFPPWWSQWWFQAQYLGWTAAAVLHLLALGWVLHCARRAPSRAALAGLAVAVHLAVVAAALAAMSLKLPHYSGLLQAPLAVLAGCSLTALYSAAVDRRRPRTTGTAALAAVVVAGVPLLLATGTHVSAVAATRVADYRAVAPAVVDAGLATSPAVVWADRGAVAAVLPQLAGSRDLPADGRPALVVVDSTVVDRLPGDVGRRWLATHAQDYTQHRDGRVTVLVRQDLEPESTP